MYSMVKAWLLNVVNKEIYDSILYYEDAAEMWNDLYLHFRVSNLPWKYQLEQSIMTLKQENLDLSTYYTKKKTLWEQLANTKTTKVKRCNCDHVQELIEDAATSHIVPYGTEWELCKTYEDKFRTWSQDQAWRRFTICLIKMRVNVLLEAHQRTTQIHLRFKFKSLLLLSNHVCS